MKVVLKSRADGAGVAIFALKGISFEIVITEWSECNYRTWKNPDISMVLAQ